MQKVLSLWITGKYQKLPLVDETKNLRQRRQVNPLPLRTAFTGTIGAR